MFRVKQFLPLTLSFLFLSCKNEGGYTYAIKDFRKPLQSHLTRIVSKRIVMSSDSSLRKMATDKELLQLSTSEHPVLRATAYREMLNRKSFNHFDILMNHLDDTAIVATDAGEFGIWVRTVSDDILQEAAWKTKEAKSKTVEQVLTKHNYLRSAYLILLEIEPQEKYYSIIKDMATRPRHISEDGYELNFDDIEHALYGLAKFRKKQDVGIIKEQLMKKPWQLSYVSFRLMKEFPDTSYLDVFQSYHRRQFYKSTGHSRNGFSGYYYDRADPEDFIKALAEQQNEGSARLLDTMLNLLPLQTCLPNKKNIIEEVIMEIWGHPCLAYARLRQKIKSQAKEILKWQLSFSMDAKNEPIDTTKENIRW